MRSYKEFLLVSDMDGTLLSGDTTISKENREAIQEFVAGGGRFAIATGRTAGNAAEYLEGLPVNSPGIFYNGAMLADMATGEVLKSCRLTGKIWRDFAAHCLQKFPQACIEVYTADQCYILSAPGQDDPRLAKEYSDYRHTTLAQVAGLDWLKFFICASRPVLEAVRHEAGKLGILEISTNFFSATTYLEFVGQEVSKGHMLEALRRLPGNAGRYVVAAGDFANDNEMLRRADCGVAPENAMPETKEAADRLGPDCDHHLWAYIIHEVLPEL